MTAHAELIAELEKRGHSKMADGHYRAHHGKSSHGAQQLHALLMGLGYYSAGPGHPKVDSWWSGVMNHPKTSNYVVIHRRTDPADHTAHHTDLMLR